MSQTSRFVVEAQNLERHYPGRPQPAVTGMSFTLEPGEVLGLVGPSGCGKSTTLRMIAGLEPLDGGTVFIDGKDASSTPPERRRVGWVPQSYGLFPYMTVASNVGYGLVGRVKSKKERERAVREAMELTQVTELAEYRPTDLSGGQRQRIALARAIASDPKVLLLDEPLAALDPQLRDSLRLQLAGILRHSGRAAIMVTHDQSEALALADKIAVLRAGRLLQVASPEELWRAPKGPFVANFVARATILEGVMTYDGSIDLGDGDMIAAEDLDVIDGSMAAGERVEVILRPRDLEPVDAGARTRIRLEVVQSEYLGDSVRVLGRIGGSSLAVEVPASHGVAGVLGLRGRRGSISVRPVSAPGAARAAHGSQEAVDTEVGAVSR